MGRDQIAWWYECGVWAKSIAPDKPMGDYWGRFSRVDGGSADWKDSCSKHLQSLMEGHIINVSKDTPTMELIDASPESDQGVQ